MPCGFRPAKLSEPFGDAGEFEAEGGDEPIGRAPCAGLTVARRRRMGGFAGPTSALAGQADKVTICHFSGHEGTFVFEGVQYTVHDFVTYYAKPRAVLCEQVGAQAITVSRQACENGHHAIQVFENRTCADGALQE